MAGVRRKQWSASISVKIRNKPATQQDHKPLLKIPHPQERTDIERPERLKKQSRTTVRAWLRQKLELQRGFVNEDIQSRFSVS